MRGDAGLAATLRRVFDREIPTYLTPDALVVCLRTVWPDRSTRALRALAAKWALHLAMTRQDHDALDSGARCRQFRNHHPLGALAASGRGVVVISFHFGPFRYVPYELIHLGFNVDAFMSGLLVKSEGASWEALTSRSGRTLRTLDAERPISALHALRGLRAGHAVMVYADAELGGDASSPEAGRVTVDFLGIPMSYRPGPVYLAWRAQAPIVLAVASRSVTGGRRVEFSDPLPPPASSDEAHLGDRLRECFAWYEERVRAAPHLWSGWAMPSYCWSELGKAPTVRASEYQAETEQIRGKLEAPRTNERSRTGAGLGRTLRSDPTETAILELGGEHILLHGRSRRFIKGTPLCCDLVRAAYDRLPIDATTSDRFGVNADQLAPEIARLVLAELAQIS